MNEERMIAEVLSSVMTVSDEIILVDSGSTDKTIEIAKSYGAKIVEQPWLGNGPQKRVGEENCSHDWLIDLDADEILSDELAAQINDWKSRSGNEDEVLSLPLITVPPFGKTWNNSSISRRNKIYNKKINRMPDHRAWDQLQITNPKNIIKLTGPLYHYSFPNVAHMIGKLNKTSSSRANNGKLKKYPSVVIRVLIAYPIYFCKHYFLRGLWRQGLYGFVVSNIAAQARWWRDIKMLEIHYKKQGKQNPKFD